MKKYNDYKIFVKVSVTVLAILFLAVIYSILSHIILESSLISLIIANTLTFTILYKVLRLLESRFQTYAFLGIVVIKLILLIVNAKTKLLFMTGVDWAGYDAYAREAINVSTNFVDLYNNSIDLFVFIMASIYKIFGANTEQIYFYIFPLSLLVLLYIYKIVHLITQNKKLAIRALFIALLWPIDIVFSVSLLREMPIQLLVAVSFYNFILFYKSKKFVRLLLSFILITLASLMHSGMVGIFIVYLYALLQKRDYKFIRIGALIAAVLCFFAFSFTPVWQSMSRRFEKIGTENGLAATFEIQNKALGDAATNYISQVPASYAEALTALPYRLFMFAFSPLPWQVYDLSTAAAFLIDGLLQIYVFYLVVKIYKNRSNIPIFKKDAFMLAIICILATYIIFGFGTNNYGTAMRHRTKVLPLVIVVLASYRLSTKHVQKEGVLINVT